MTTAEEIPAIDVLEMLTTDHRGLERLFAEVRNKDADQAREWVVGELVSQLLTHAFIEEQVLYSAIRTAVPGGEELADAAVEEHQALEETLARLEAVDPNDHEAEILLAHLQRDLRRHVDEEEGVLFLMLRSELGERRLVEMAGELEEARRAAPRPSRGHGSGHG